MKVNIIRQSYKKKLVLNNIFLEINSPSIIGIVGPNGSGKSTLLKVILGLITEFEGSIDYQNKLVVGMAEMPKLDYQLTGRDTLEYLLNRKWNNSNDMFLINDYVDKKVRTYSLGMRQRLILTYLFTEQSDIIVLDEPINGLDVDAVELLNTQINKAKVLGKTVVITSHILSYLEGLVDEVYFIKDGAFAKHINNISSQDYYEFEFNNADNAQTFASLYEDVRIMSNKVYLSVEQGIITEIIKEAVEYSVIQVTKSNILLENEYYKVGEDNEKRA